MNYRKALGIGAVSNFVSFALSFVSVIVVSRLLTPDEIGIFSVAVSILGISHVFRDFGVGQYLVQAKTVGRTEFRAAFSVTLFSSWAIAGLLFLGRHPFATFYGHEGIANVLALLSLNFVILPFGAPLLALLQRELEFGKLAVVRICNSTVSTAVTVATAWVGESYLSMAWGALAGHISNIVLLNFMRPGKVFLLPSVTGLGDVMRFGALSTTTSVVTEVGASLPDLILGRTLGFSAVAFYSRAYGLRRMLLDQILNLVRGVHFPSFAQGIREGKDPADLYTQVMIHVVAITAPVMALAALLAEPLILLLFGIQWERSIYLATVICTATALTTPYSLAPSSLIAAGKVKATLPIEITIQSLRGIVLASSIVLPLEQVVLGLAAALVLSNVLYQRAMQKAFSLHLRSFLTRLLPSFALVPFALVGPILAILSLSPDSSHTATRHFWLLACSGVLALGGWLLGIRVLRHPIQGELAKILSSALNRLRPNRTKDH